MTVRILLVEDDRALREALEDSLAVAGYSCVAVADAEQALRELSQRVFSLMLSDINMPGMSGLQLLENVKKRYMKPPPVVMMITAYGDAENYKIAKELGADDFLTKPVDFVALKEKLNLTNG